MRLAVIDVTTIELAAGHLQERITEEVGVWS